MGLFADDAIEPALEVAHSMVEQFLPEMAEPLRQRCREVCPPKALYAQLNTFQDELLPPSEAESAADPDAEEAASAGQEAAQWSDKESASGGLPRWQEMNGQEHAGVDDLIAQWQGDNLPRIESYALGTTGLGAAGKDLCSLKLLAGLRSGGLFHPGQADGCLLQRRKRKARWSMDPQAPSCMQTGGSSGCRASQQRRTCRQRWPRRTSCRAGRAPQLQPRCHSRQRPRLPDWARSWGKRKAQACRPLPQCLTRFPSRWVIYHCNPHNQRGERMMITSRSQKGPLTGMRDNVL